MKTEVEGSEEAPKEHSDFPQWLETEDGKKCLAWPISEPKYLQNRLFWAFDAGRNCVWDMYIKQKAENAALKESLKELLTISTLYKALPSHNKISLNATHIVIEKAAKLL